MDNASEGPVKLDVSQVAPAPDNQVDAVRAGLQSALGISGGQVSVEVAGSTNSPTKGG